MSTMEAIGALIPVTKERFISQIREKFRRSRIEFIIVVLHLFLIIFDIYPHLNTEVEFFAFVLIGTFWYAFEKYINGKIKALRQNETIVVKDPEQINMLLHNIIDSVRDSVREIGTRVLVFVWKSDKKSSHASLLLWDREMAYISHYPQYRVPRDERFKLHHPACNHTLEEDLNPLINDGGLRQWNPPHEIIIIPEGQITPNGIANIRTWFRERLTAIDEQTQQFKFKFENCANAVKEALEFGGFELVNSADNILKLGYFGLTTPEEVIDRIRRTILLHDSPNFLKALYSICDVLFLVFYIYVIKTMLFLIARNIIIATKITFVVAVLFVVKEFVKPRAHDFQCFEGGTNVSVGR